MATPTAVAAVVFIALLSLSTSFSISEYVTLLQNKVLYYLAGVSSALQIVFMAAAVVAMIAVLCRSAPVSSARVSAAAVSAFSVYLQLICMAFLVAACVCQDVIGLVAQSSCIGVVAAECRSAGVAAVRVLDLVCVAVRTVFTVVAFGFCCRYGGRRRLAQSTLTLVGVTLIETAALGACVYAVLEESVPLPTAANVTGADLTACKAVASHDAGLVACIARQTDTYAMYADAGPYLYPCFVEFVLLFAASVVAAWSGSGHGGPAARHRPGADDRAADDEHRSLIRNIALTDDEEPPINAASAASDQCASQPVIDPSSASADDVQQQHGADGDQDAAGSKSATPLPQQQSVTDGQQQQGDRKQREFVVFPCDCSTSCDVASCSRCLRSFPFKTAAVLAFLAANVVFVALGLGANVHLVDTPSYYWTSFLVYRLFYWALLIVTVGSGFLLTWQLAAITTPGVVPDSPPSPTGTSSALEWLFVACALGPIVCCTFGIVAFVFQGRYVPYNTQAEFVADQALCIVQTGLQTLVYFGAKHVVVASETGVEASASESPPPDGPGDGRNRAGNQPLSRTGLQGVLLALAFSNAALWLYGSFVETRASVGSMATVLYLIWPYIYSAFNPLALLYRLVSVLTFVDVFLKLR